MKHPHNRRERMQLDAVKNRGTDAVRKNTIVKKKSLYEWGKDPISRRRATIEEKEAEDDIREEVH